MKLPLRALYAPALIAGAMVLTSACGGSSTPLVTLELDQFVEVDFDDMIAEVPEEALIPFSDMRDESRYVDLLPQLRCAGVDLQGSYLKITELQAAGVVPLNVQVLVAPYAGAHEPPDGTYQAGEFTLLGEFDASVSPGETIAMTSPKWTVMQEGVDLLSNIALSDQPRYSVIVTGEALDPVDALLIEVNIQLGFANRAGGCSGGVNTLPAPQ